MASALFAPVQPREFVTVGQLYGFLFSDALVRAAAARSESLIMPWGWNCYGLRREKVFDETRGSRPEISFRDFCAELRAGYQHFLDRFHLKLGPREISDDDAEVEQIVQDITTRYHRARIIRQERFNAAWCETCERSIDIYGFVEYCPHCQAQLVCKEDTGLFLTVEKNLVRARNQDVHWHPLGVGKRISDLVETMPSRTRITATRHYGIRDRRTGLMLDPKYPLSLWPMVAEELGIPRPVILVQGIRDLRKFAYAILAHAYRDRPDTFPILRGYAHASIAEGTGSEDFDPREAALRLLRNWTPEVIRLGFWYTSFQRDVRVTRQLFDQSARIMESLDTARRFFRQKALRGRSGGSPMLAEIDEKLSRVRELLGRGEFGHVWRQIRELLSRVIIARCIPKVKKNPLHPSSINALLRRLDVIQSVFG